MIKTKQTNRKKLIHAFAVMNGVGWGGFELDPELELELVPLLDEDEDGFAPDDEEEDGFAPEDEEEDGLADEEEEEGFGAEDDDDEEGMVLKGIASSVLRKPRKARRRSTRARGWIQGLGPGSSSVTKPGWGCEMNTGVGWRMDESGGVKLGEVVEITEGDSELVSVVDVGEVAVVSVANVTLRLINDTQMVRSM